MIDEEPAVQVVELMLERNGEQPLSFHHEWMAAGIPAERVMVAAGLDLGKTPAQSALLLKHSDDLVALGFPVFLSASNKRFLGELVGTEVHDRREASLAAHALCIARGGRILRAHDVRGSRRVADVMAAILSRT